MSHPRLLLTLARHDLRGAYAGTIGGLAWAVVTPLIPLAVFIAIFSLGLHLRLGRTPYGFGFASAYVAWVLLAGSITGAASSILQHRQLVKRVRFPTQVLPIAPLLVNSIPHAVLVGVTSLVCITAGYGQFPQLLAVPYFYICAMVLAAGVGLMLASISVVLRDIPHILTSAIQVWFWLTPVAWVTGALPSALRPALLLNPAAYVVSGYRWALMPRVFGMPTASAAVAFWAMALILLAAAARCFGRLRPNFWEHL